MPGSPAATTRRRATGSHVEPGSSLRSAFVFGVDARRNTFAQVLVKSVSGFVATGRALWVYYGALPAHRLATRVARGAVVFLARLGLVLEVPLVLWGLATRRVPPLVDVHPAPRV